MRLFYAAEIPEEQRGELHEIQKKLMKSKADVKWVEPQNLHMTLRFLGEVAPKLLPILEGIGSKAGKLNTRFSVSLKNLGSFPEHGIPRVVWVGIDQGISSLSMLAQALEDRLEKLNVKKNHPFKSHLTLGRVKSLRSAEELVALMESINYISQEWSLKNFVLKESILSKFGPTYKTLYSFPLKP